MLIDMPTVQATITARSRGEPRTKATASASAMPKKVSRMVSGTSTSTLSDGRSRLAMMWRTGSPVLHALPKSKVTICLTKIHSWIW